MNLGDKLLRLCRMARDDVFVVAPFVKANSLERLLAVLSAEVSLTLVTRWRPEEIVVGVSDLAVWTLLRQRPRSRLVLRDDLHAKYYRADDRCLVGSANLTAAALGWAARPNLELLVETPIDHTDVASFEARLLSDVVVVDEALAQHMAELVAQLAPLLPPMLTAEVSDVAPEVDLTRWVPSLRSPENLYTAYCGRAEDLPTTIREAALYDLHAFRLPAGLTRPAFEQYVNYQLGFMPIIRRVDDFVANPQRFGAVRDLLKTLPCAEQEDFHADYVWQTMMRWLLYFNPQRYALAVPHHSEIFCRR
ncbi:MAG: phospholipase D family protein [Anaerolineae bacterium]|nr:phospholipase D family protein [Anaerolineae bacterium]MDW8172093.1 phospholipase D family protein [Anaerolineae bacterium]